jgi:hypothetical protein
MHLLLRWASLMWSLVSDHIIYYIDHFSRRADTRYANRPSQPTHESVTK